MLQSQYFDSHNNSNKVFEVDTMMLCLNVIQFGLYGCHPLGLYQIGQAMFFSLKKWSDQYSVLI